ncbi:T9SS type A sorting domain-containing protein [Runella sp. SP2]|uniref:T9SS type A sorting domain-containing protein n=1 Tax=Runella sp. SP2 TaxID=2268026 RepID=UPI000F07F7B1|nr:T9SS type A sorting domain-containing protein [Runella sp. SP2]AYQ34744.1 T9SS C-terminal target domain-containing protein [Runella sp. SP2]
MKLLLPNFTAPLVHSFASRGLAGIVLGVCTTFTALAQSFSFQWDNAVAVTIQGKKLLNPWAGGLNNAQFSKMHLNDDGVEDLVVFERSSHSVNTFLAVPQATGHQWKHAPEYETRFPADMLHWMLLVDFDQDGRKDLFTSTNGGIRVFRNVATSNGFSWSLIADPILTQGFSGNINLYVPSTDLPAIADIDDDGDIDILTFDFTGTSVELHQNFSKEQKSTNPFIFKKTTNNWGRFSATSFCDQYLFNLPPIDVALQNPSNARIAHAGNTLWVGDLNGDGKKDVLHGHVACDNVVMLTNVGGNGMAALIGSAQASFPSITPINFPVFPSPYLEDIDGDGQKDLIASPSSTDIATNPLLNLRQSNWLYKNEGTTTNPKFTYRQMDFLQDGMIDLGENATPALADIDGDGDLDLVAGYGGLRATDGYRAGIAFFRNTGNATQAAFEFINEDFLGLSAQLFKKENVSLVNAKPFFADLNGDGTTDLGFWANTFRGMDIRYLPNLAPRGQAMRLDTSRITKMPLPKNFTNGENLLYYDIDKDGKLDVLVSKNSGNVEFHQNVGSTASPIYELKSEAFGGIDVDFERRAQGMVVADLNADQKPELIMGDLLGRLRVYQNFTTLTTFKSDSNLIFNAFSNKSEFIRIGVGLFPAVGDVNGDQLPELLIGSNTGGIRFLKNNSPKGTPTGNELEFFVYPNPTSNFLYAQVPEKGTLELFSISGQFISSIIVPQPTTELPMDISKLPAGLYLLRFTTANDVKMSQKVIITR